MRATCTWRCMHLNMDIYHLGVAARPRGSAGSRRCHHPVLSRRRCSSPRLFMRLHPLSALLLAMELSATALRAGS